MLVNNAGINDNAGLEHGSPQKFLRSLELNLLHYYNMAHHALPALKIPQGCIINIYIASKGCHHRTRRHFRLRRG